MALTPWQTKTHGLIDAANIQHAKDQELGLVGNPGQVPSMGLDIGKLTQAAQEAWRKSIETDVQQTDAQGNVTTVKGYDLSGIGPQRKDFASQQAYEEALGQGDVANIHSLLFGNQAQQPQIPGSQMQGQNSLQALLRLLGIQLPTNNVGGGGLQFMANGGIVTQPTAAIVGERGPEMVMGGGGNTAFSPSQRTRTRGQRKQTEAAGMEPLGSGRQYSPITHPYSQLDQVGQRSTVAQGLNPMFSRDQTALPAAQGIGRSTVYPGGAGSFFPIEALAQAQQQMMAPEEQIGRRAQRQEGMIPSMERGAFTAPGFINRPAGITSGRGQYPSTMQRGGPAASRSDQLLQSLLGQFQSGNLETFSPFQPTGQDYRGFDRWSANIPQVPLAPGPLQQQQALSQMMGPINQDMHDQLMQDRLGYQQQNQLAGQSLYHTNFPWMNQPVFNPADATNPFNPFGGQVYGLAGGGRINQPLMALVGEEGPELAMLQPGDAVIPLPEGQADNIAKTLGLVGMANGGFVDDPMAQQRRITEPQREVAQEKMPSKNIFDALGIPRVGAMGMYQHPYAQQEQLREFGANVGQMVIDPAGPPATSGNPLGLPPMAAGQRGQRMIEELLGEGQIDYAPPSTAQPASATVVDTNISEPPDDFEIPNFARFQIAGQNRNLTIKDYEEMNALIDKFDREVVAPAYEYAYSLEYQSPEQLAAISRADELKAIATAKRKTVSAIEEAQVKKSAAAYETGVEAEAAEKLAAAELNELMILDQNADADRERLLQKDATDSALAQAKFESGEAQTEWERSFAQEQQQYQRGKERSEEQRKIEANQAMGGLVIAILQSRGIPINPELAAVLSSGNIPGSSIAPFLGVMLQGQAAPQATQFGFA
jgi:hypothetical protein